MGKEIRRVPRNWQHPKQIKKQYHPAEGYKIEEQYRPMYQHTTFEEAVKEFKDGVKEWIKGYKAWQKGYYINYEDKKETKEEAFKRWEKHILEERKKWNFRDDYCADELMKYQTGICSYADIAGEPPRYPNPDDYMPEGEWWQLYEDVSEGTPLSPAFETPEELIEWLSTNKDYWGAQWTREQAEAMVAQGSAPSFVMADGKLYNSQESLVMDKEAA